ncbi:MAG: EboA domain-containing protein [Mucilaginibacter sp.]|nr:EboA domain-containing protein [Mucilaginibacter sp.]
MPGKELKTLLTAILRQNMTADAWAWLSSQADTGDMGIFNRAFSVMPRKTGKALLVISPGQIDEWGRIHPGSSVEGWTTDRLARVWLLLQLDSTDQDQYFRALENLFSVAEMNESVALYSALPFLAYPDLWINRCVDGIRSNMGNVLEAIMYRNCYPAENLGEAAWNQLVLKAFFTEKDLSSITGIDERANAELSRVLIDYARERRAAGRPVDPMLWVIAGKFVDIEIINQFKQGSREKPQA